MLTKNMTAELSGYNTTEPTLPTHADGRPFSEFTINRTLARRWVDVVLATIGKPVIR